MSKQFGGTYSLFPRAPKAELKCEKPRSKAETAGAYPLEVTASERGDND
jgi:hypothetical protein